MRVWIERRNPFANCEAPGENLAVYTTEALQKLFEAYTPVAKSYVEYRLNVNKDTIKDCKRRIEDFKQIIADNNNSSISESLQPEIEKLERHVANLETQNGNYETILADTMGLVFFYMDRAKDIIYEEMNMIEITDF